MRDAGFKLEGKEYLKSNRVGVYKVTTSKEVNVEEYHKYGHPNNNKPIESSNTKH